MSNDLFESWEVNSFIGTLSSQAVTSAQSIRDPRIRSCFNEHMADFNHSLLKEYENGYKSRDDILFEVEEEIQLLIDQSYIAGSKGIGFIAGIMQVAGGGALCAESVGLLCAIGAPMIAHGANNIYENGDYFINGNENTSGWLREGYREGAKLFGLSESGGDIAYSVADLGLSGYGLFSKTLRPPFIPQFETSKRFKLFHYLTADYVYGYKAMSNTSLAIEGMADIATIKAVSGYSKKD
ncbi:DUF4225 domain-containing protein [Photobacterium indicum]|uniref:DUF4225 domain-containing protein n=1 Tax=Photobacterium indicum TaxID=81447 RepID=UPI003D1357BA